MTLVTIHVSQNYDYNCADLGALIELRRIIIRIREMIIMATKGEERGYQTEDLDDDNNVYNMVIKVTNNKKHYCN